MKPIPLVLISTGGIFIVAGMNKTDPLSLIKSILTGGTVPKNTSGQSSVSGGTAAVESYGVSAPTTGRNSSDQANINNSSSQAGINRSLN